MSALPTTLTLRSLVREPKLAPAKKKRMAASAAPAAPLRSLKPSPKPRENPTADFPAVYQAYRRRIYSQCFCMLRNHGDAEDAAQEVFLQLFRKAHTFRGESSFSTWLYRLTTNCILMEIRRKRQRSLEGTPREASVGADTGSPVLDPPLDAFQAPSAPIFERIGIGSAMSQLPSGYQRIFQLHDVEGYTHEEIAVLLGIRVGTSKSQLHKARLRMRLLL
jgi:RNA polymerase sigma-70 factor, ECF subfamily